jgi:hypothetical protein
MKIISNPLGKKINISISPLYLFNDKNHGPLCKNLKSETLI